MKGLNAANALTLARLAAVPFLWREIIAHREANALWICLAAGLTDGLDGWLARRYGWVTRAGAYLDPVADKAMLCTAYLALAITGAAPWWLVGVIFGRDLAILAVAGAMYLGTTLRDFPPSLWGKISTLFQIGLAAAILGERAWAGAGLGSAWLTVAVAVLTCWSGVDYGRLAWKRWRALPRPAPGRASLGPTPD